MKKANIDELKLSDVRPGVSRRSFSGEGATLAWGTLSPGHEPRPHTHPHEQIVYIVSGHGQFTVGDETADVTAGDMLVVPSGVLPPLILGNKRSSLASTSPRDKAFWSVIITSHLR